MRILIDYRPALRARTGVGEYTHQLVRALLAAQDVGDELTIFSSSWKHRVQDRARRELDGVRVADLRIPVRTLNFAWHRLGWPPVEQMTAQSYDVTHSLHPLLIPSRRAAQVITIHDLDFLRHPERARAEIRRDYPALVRSHAQRADRVVVVSQYTAEQVERLLGVAPERISLCPGGVPPWSEPSEAGRQDPRRKYILFFGTLEPRKNIGGLLDAYERLIERRENVPRLVLAGHAPVGATAWLARLERAPLAGRATHIGYVHPDDRQALYEGSRLVVLPSFEEGFGLPVLEAMSLGIPVVASNCGAIPEVLGDAGLAVDPHDPAALADALDRMISDEALASASAAKGRLRARHFSWVSTARRVKQAYGDAIVSRARPRRSQPVS